MSGEYRFGVAVARIGRYEENGSIRPERSLSTSDQIATPTGEPSENGVLPQ